MVDQSCADRAEQGSLYRVLSSAADDHHVRIFGQLDKGRHGRHNQQLGVDLGLLAVAHAVFGGLDRIGDDLARILSMLSVKPSRDRHRGTDG
jgi:hypothetical protein